MILHILLLLIFQSIYVIDGDTIKDTDYDSNRLRLVHIDAPEKLQFYGDTATLKLQEFIKNKKVSYSKTETDQYNRPLVIVFANGENINLKMVETGNAWSWKYTKDTTYINAMYRAKKQKLGLWKHQNPLDPSDYRKQQKQ